MKLAFSASPTTGHAPDGESPKTGFVAGRTRVGQCPRRTKVQEGHRLAAAPAIRPSWGIIMFTFPCGDNDSSARTSTWRQTSNRAQFRVASDLIWDPFRSDRADALPMSHVVSRIPALLSRVRDWLGATADSVRNPHQDTFSYAPRAFICALALARPSRPDWPARNSGLVFLSARTDHGRGGANIFQFLCLGLLRLVLSRALLLENGLHGPEVLHWCWPLMLLQETQGTAKA
jgi:hypothetical protein